MLPCEPNDDDGTPTNQSLQERSTSEPVKAGSQVFNTAPSITPWALQALYAGVMMKCTIKVHLRSR